MSYTVKRLKRANKRHNESVIQSGDQSEIKRAARRERAALAASEHEAANGNAETMKTES